MSRCSSASGHPTGICVIADVVDYDGEQVDRVSARHARTLGGARRGVACAGARRRAHHLCRDGNDAAVQDGGGVARTAVLDRATVLGDHAARLECGRPRRASAAQHAWPHRVPDLGASSRRRTVTPTPLRRRRPSNRPAIRAPHTPVAFVTVLCGQIKVLGCQPAVFGLAPARAGRARRRSSTASRKMSPSPGTRPRAGPPYVPPRPDERWTHGASLSQRSDRLHSLSHPDRLADSGVTPRATDFADYDLTEFRPTRSRTPTSSTPCIANAARQARTPRDPPTPVERRTPP